MKPPAFQFYADDFLAGVADMTQAEVGAYILLLCHQWGRGEIPADAERAALVAKGGISPHVAAKFPGGKNQRLEAERLKQAEFRAQSAAGGRESAKVRGGDSEWGRRMAAARHDANRMRTGCEPGCEPDANSPSPSPSPIDSVSPPPVSTPPARAREELRQEPDPNYLPPAPPRGAHPSKRKPNDLQECLAMAARIGWGASEASRWHSDMEASGWAKVDGTPFGNWSREMCIARDRAREQAARNGNGKPVAAPTHSGPSLREVQAYAREKDAGDGRAIAYAASWFRVWEGRGWRTKDRRTLDWQVRFSADWADQGAR